LHGEAAFAAGFFAGSVVCACTATPSSKTPAAADAANSFVMAVTLLPPNRSTLPLNQSTSKAAISPRGRASPHATQAMTKKPGNDEAQ
jgi:hypothetical protein